MSDNGARIEREFDASIDDVWEMWTDPAKFQSWYGANGFAIPVAKMDVTVGGTRKISMEMKTPDRVMQMWFIGEYKVVTPKTRLVYSESMSDPDGNILSPAISRSESYARSPPSAIPIFILFNSLGTKGTLSVRVTVNPSISVM